MLFNPEESIDFHGFTGPFIQFTHARLKSILRKETATVPALPVTGLLPSEKNIIITLEQFPAVIDQASRELNPSLIALYAFDLSKAFSSLLTELSVLNAESEEKKQLRLRLCEMTAHVVASSMHLLGIAVPERM